MKVLLEPEEIKSWGAKNVKCYDYRMLGQKDGAGYIFLIGKIGHPVTAWSWQLF